MCKALGGCNTGEKAAVIDHEWGHALDDFDVNGTLSSSSEGYADIAAIYRSRSSCVGYGFWWTYVDTEVLPCRTCSYNVVAAGTSSACFGRAGNCARATPTSSPLLLCAEPSPDPLPVE